MPMRRNTLCYYALRHCLATMTHNEFPYKEIMMKRFLRPMLLITLLTYSAMCLALYFGQRSFIYHPTPAAKEGADQAITLDVGDAKLKVSARQIKSEAALIYFGGNADNVAHSLPYYAKAFPDHAIYMLHYRGYSGSSGTPTEAALHADAKKLYDFVSVHHGKITVIGRSLGSGVATRLAASQKVDKLVLITPYDSILNLAKRQFPFFPIDFILEDRFESAKYAPQISAPTVILAAQHDQIIPLANTKALFGTFAKGLAELKILPDSDHHTIVMRPDYFELMK